MSLPDLIKATERLTSITEYEAAGARELPSRYARDADRVRLNLNDIHYSDQEKISKLAGEAVAIVKARLRRRGEIERDDKLRQLASELEQLRAVLPQLAAQAAIELGALARAMREEAGEP